MLKAFASMKSFRAKDGSDEPPEGGRNGERNFRKQKRSNKTHVSATDPDARLYRKADGQESRLAYLGHALMENRNGLAVAGAVTHATGTGEREAATQLSAGLGEGATLGADKGYDVEELVKGLKQRKIEPRVAINGSVSKTGKVRKTAVPPQVATSPGYAASRFEFVDAFLESRNWFVRSYLAIDQGPIVITIENFRTGLIWNLFMGAAEVRDGLVKLGFRSPHLDQQLNGQWVSAGCI